MTNTTVKTVSTVEEQVNFCKRWFELATGMDAKELQDDRSSYERDGLKYSYLFDWGNTSNHETRFELWVTARKRDGVFCDMYIGDTYIATETIELIDELKKYVAYHKSNETKYTRVPMHIVRAFLKKNELSDSPVTSKNSTVKKSESVTA